MSVQQPFLFSGMFLLKLAGHVPDVTKLSIDFNWLIIFVLFFAINFFDWRVYSCLVKSFGCILYLSLQMIKVNYLCPSNIEIH